MPPTNTSTSLGIQTNSTNSSAEQNAGATNSQLSIGSGTSYVGGSGTAVNVSGADLANTIGDSISNQFNLGDPAAVGALSSAIEGDQRTAQLAELALGQLAGSSNTNPASTPVSSSSSNLKKYLPFILLGGFLIFVLRS